jgi:UDP:flavonoid glycosyltransferase YjiC (YdhE family)
MRVLVVSAPLQGHLLPLIPLAAACRDAGHDVLLASGGDVLEIDTAGLPAQDIAPHFSFGRTATRVLLRHPIIGRRELAGRAGVTFVGRLFGAANASFADEVIALAERARPDLIVHEPLAAIGAVAAGRIGVPSVLQENLLFAAPELLAAVAASPPIQKMTVPAAELAITISPPSVVGPRPGRQMRPVPFSGGGEVPEWLLTTPERGRIIVTHSTVPGPGSGDPTAAVVAAATRLDAEIVLVRPSEKLRLDGLPPNVRVVGRVPLDRVLPHAAAVVHHGGAGSVLGALAAGVPQLVCPGPGDRRHNAALVARRGAGLAVEAKSITAATLIRLISDAALVTAAREVRDEIAAMPPPADLVPELEALVRAG